MRKLDETTCILFYIKLLVIVEVFYIIIAPQVGEKHPHSTHISNSIVNFRIFERSEIYIRNYAHFRAHHKKG